MKNGAIGGNEATEIPASALLRARALACWANSVGMTGTQRDIHLYVASLLATCDQCYISVSELARRIGKTRQGCVKAIADGGRFFEHDGYVRDSSERRLWRLVTKMPTMAQLAPFMPPRKKSTDAESLPVPDNKPVSPSTTKLSRPPDNRVAQSVNSPSVRYGEKKECVGVGGGNAHHQPPDGPRVFNEGQEGERDACPDMQSKEYPRFAAIHVLGVLQQIAKEQAAGATKLAGISKGSEEWSLLYPADGSVTYRPSDADLEYLLPLVEAARANGRRFIQDSVPLMAGWVCQQVKVAISSRMMFRDCLRMSALSKYLSGFEGFSEAEA